MGSKKNKNPQAQSSSDIANQTLTAQQQTFGPSAQLFFDILSNPNFGVGATTQLFEDVRRSVFPQESAVRDQLAQNVLANLISPTGISPEQQTAIDTRRRQSQDELTDALRTRANLGGGLFGGRAANTEQRAVSDLQNQFAEQDIDREERARLNAINSALPFLQILFPQAGIQSPNFQSPVPGANNLLSASTANRGMDIQYNTAQDALRSQLLSSLFNSVGSAAAGKFFPTSTP